MAVKGRERLAVKILRTSGNRCRVVMVTDMDLGRGVSKKICKFVMERSLAELPSIQVYFELLKGVDEIGAEDGRVLGHAMLWGDNADNRLEKMEKILKMSVAIQELTSKYPWLPLFFKEIRKGKLILNKSVGTKLACVTDKDAKQIGKNLIPALKSRKTAEAGILQWKKQNPAMVELTDEHPWVENMLVVLARGVVKSAAWGLMWRGETRGEEKRGEERSEATS